MARLYTFDEKLLTGSPEIRIGDKVYQIDDRKSTVQKAIRLFSEDKGDSITNADEVLKLAFGKNYKEIETLDMPFSAYQKLTEMVISAMTGTETEKSDGFQ